jgi:BirA family transcriptional regulator, biotin operon repressor / biotin---[acetyl-CoA-carboxylase] ligase
MKKDLKNFIVLDQIDSTNNYANHMISTGIPENGTVVLAHFQNLGKGQRENSWESASRMNMLASIILYPDFLPPSKQFYLSKITSLAIAGWLSKKIPDVSVKWPNDIYAGNRKIAGILIETSVMGSALSSAVIGIGLNLNQMNFSSNIPNPVSLKMITGAGYDPVIAANEIREGILNWIQRLTVEAYAEIDALYLNQLFRYNVWAWYSEKGRLLEARIIGVGEYGQLLLEDRTGNIYTYMFKEIEFVI